MIPARDAIICWDGDLKKVIVRSKHSHPIPGENDLKSSGGAAFAFWNESSSEELYYRLLQLFIAIVRDDGVPIDVANNAFMVIPEYVMSLPPCKEQDDLLSSGVTWEKPTGFGKGYPL